MAKKNNHIGSKFAVGALIAGAAGYITGILTAPKAGQYTRKEIADKAVGAKMTTVQELDLAYKELVELTKKAKDKSVALSATARNQFDDALVKARDAQDKAAHVLKAVKTGEAEDPELNKAIKQARQAKKNLGKYFTS